MIFWLFCGSLQVCQVTLTQPSLRGLQVLTAPDSPSPYSECGKRINPACEPGWGGRGDESSQKTQTKQQTTVEEEIKEHTGESFD